jgi:T5SS/PEP-CTERM-associated repeat protein
VAIGNASGAAGTLTVDNEGSLLDTTAAGSDIIVGNAGTGTLTVRDGASVVPADDVIVGSAATGVGTVTVTGTGGLPLPVPSSLLDLTGSGKDITVGSLGDGFFNVLAGARVNADEMFVGLSPGSNGVVNVGGIGGILNANSQINIATGLHLGDNPGVGLSGGSSTFAVNDGGIVTVLGTTRIGDPAGVGSGTLTVNEGGVFTTNSLIATDTGGFLNMLGGELRIDGGSLQVRNDVLTLTGDAGGSPRINLENSATCSLASRVATSETLIIGNGSAGEYAVETGSRLTVTNGDIILGRLASGSENGRLLCQHPDSSVSAPTGRVVVVGDAGRGILTLASLGHMSCGSVNVGRAATGIGFVDVVGGATLDVTGSLAIGGTAAAGFGMGIVTIGGGSTVNVTSGGPDTTSVHVWSAGDSLTVGQGGTLRADGIVLIGLGSGLSLDGGTIDCRVLRIGPPSESVRGTVMGELSVPGAVNVLTLSGDLLLTDGAASLADFFNVGAIDVGNNTFTFTSANLNPRRLDNCNLGAGGLLTSPMPLTVAALKTLSGDGTIDAPIINSGSILSQGGGLTFTKILSGVGQGISGTTITFGSGGGFTGSGTFSNSTPITALAGSVITATGDLTMGSAASNIGFNGNFCSLTINGDFDVTLHDSSQASVGFVTFPASSSGSPSVRCTTGLAVVGTASGTGTLASDSDSVVVVAGSLSPHGTGIGGIISLEGDALLGPNSRIQLDILGVGSSDLIRTVSTTMPAPPFIDESDITLGGTLELRVNPAHTPINGDEHTLIQCSGNSAGGGQLLGSFATIITPPRWHIVERTTGVAGVGVESLIAVYCLADFNDDGFLDFFDYDEFVECFETGACGLGTPDFNGDGFVDFFDYDDFVLAFETGC